MIGPPTHFRDMATIVHYQSQRNRCGIQKHLECTIIRHTASYALGISLYLHTFECYAANFAHGSWVKVGKRKLSHLSPDLLT